MVSWGVAFGKGLRIFLWSIAWGVVGGLVALAITWGILTNPSSIATNPEAFILVLFLAIVVSTLVASIGIFASIFKVTVEGTIELTGGPSISHPVNLTETETEPSTAVTAPAAPTNLIATGRNKGLIRGRVDLSWRPPQSERGSRPTGYRVYRGTSAETLSPLATVDDQNFDVFDRRVYHWYLDENVHIDSVYYYQVTALNSVGESAPSNMESVETGRKKYIACPKCEWDNLPAAETCRQCGSVLPRLYPRLPVPLCPNCGNKLLEDKETKEQVCLFCGYAPSNSAKGPQSKTPPEKP